MDGCRIDCEHVFEEQCSQSNEKRMMRVYMKMEIILCFISHVLELKQLTNTHIVVYVKTFYGQFGKESGWRIWENW